MSAIRGGSPIGVRANEIASFFEKVAVLGQHPDWLIIDGGDRGTSIDNVKRAIAAQQPRNKDGGAAPKGETQAVSAPRAPLLWTLRGHQNRPISAETREQMEQLPQVAFALALSVAGLVNSYGIKGHTIESRTRDYLKQKGELREGTPAFEDAVLLGARQLIVGAVASCITGDIFSGVPDLVRPAQTAFYLGEAHGGADSPLGHILRDALLATITDEFFLNPFDRAEATRRLDVVLAPRSLGELLARLRKPSQTAPGGVSEELIEKINLQIRDLVKHRYAAADYRRMSMSAHYSDQQKFSGYASDHDRFFAARANELARLIVDLTEKLGILTLPPIPIEQSATSS